MEKKTYEVVGMHCVSCSTGIRKLLSKQKAIDTVEVELSSSHIHITFKEDADDGLVRETVNRLGYKAKPAE